MDALVCTNAFATAIAAGRFPLPRGRSPPYAAAAVPALRSRRCLPTRGLLRLRCARGVDWTDPSFVAVAEKPDAGAEAWKALASAGGGGIEEEEDGPFEAINGDGGYSVEESVSENLMLAEKHRIEKEQNNQLRDQISRLLEVEQEQKIKMHERDLTIQSLQAKLKSIESQLNEALNSSDARSTIGSESASVISTPKMMESTADSSSVTKRLEEELAKRDALIEKLHEENEKLFDRLTEKSGLGSSPQAPSPSNKQTNAQGRDIGRSDSTKSQSSDVFPLPVSQDKAGNSGAIVKSSNELTKTTPAGEYLTSALMDFDPNQFEGVAAIADGANKLLMLPYFHCHRDYYETPPISDWCMIMQQMRTDTVLLTKEEGGSPIRNPPTAAEDARLASLISLDNIIKQVKEVMRQSSARPLRKSKKKALLESLDDLLAQMPSLLDVDHPCAQKQIMEARKVVELQPAPPPPPFPEGYVPSEQEKASDDLLASEALPPQVDPIIDQGPAKRPRFQ
ncbi:hypothetical protein OsI_22167 [Oryza sativa Indica Group]|uniref:Uncharacterized protein n=1 Tax=Oryza sativa subsp. indica TaxID=39946 RepID=A2YAQ1_ORYSI|nr:hypothetical protein OsI_22167 [Oryza sativa Indica Group]